MHCDRGASPLILSTDWNWYSSNRISFMDSWMEEKLYRGSLTITLVSAKSTWGKIHRISFYSLLPRDLHLDLHSGFLADAFIQSDLQ